jgi:hypothetical protein
MEMKQKIIKMLNYKFFFILLTFIFVGCKTQKSIQSTEKTDNFNSSTQINNSKQIDSIYIFKHDSIVIQQKGDTVFSTKFLTKIMYLNKLKVDTIVKTDTVRKEIVKYEENIIVQKVKFLDKVKYGFIFSLILLTLFIIIKKLWAYYRNLKI